MSLNPVLEAEDLSVAYAGNTALSLSRLAIGPRELVGVVGANGAGKSTLVNSLLGWSRGSPKISGTIRLGGREISTMPTHQRVRAGLLLIPEGKLVFGRMTVEENLIGLGDVPSDE